MEGPLFGEDDLENAFGSVENEIAPVLRDVLRTRKLPSEREAMSLLLHLPALNAARPPAEIDSFANAADQLLRSRLANDLTPELHQKILGDWRATGRDVSGVDNLEDLKRRIVEGRIRAVFEKNFLLTYVMGRASTLVDILHTRQWALLHASEETGHFISSDRPVVLLNNRNLNSNVQPRFDDRRFDVIMPLSKEFCLIGHYYGRDGEGQASDSTLRLINHITEASASDLIYSPRREYHVLDSEGITPEVSEVYQSDVLRTFH